MGISLNDTNISLGSLLQEEEDESQKQTVKADSQLGGTGENSPNCIADVSINCNRVPRAEVRKAYLQLAKHYHPDKGGDQDFFVTLQSAYECLTRAESTA